MVIILRKDISEIFKPTLEKCRKDFDELFKKNLATTNLSYWAEKALTWANILQHRARLASPAFGPASTRLGEAGVASPAKRAKLA